MNYTNWLLAIVVLIVLLIIKHEHDVQSNIYDLKRTDFNNIEFNTGDIILVRHDYIYDFDLVRYLFLSLIGNFISESVFTHACMVVVMDNVPYVYHTHLDPGYDHYTGSYKYKFVGMEKLYDYVNKTNSEFVYHKYEGPSIHQQVMTMIHNYEKKKITYTMNPVNFVNVVSPGQLRFGTEYICTHLLAEILQKLKIFNNKIPSYKHSPKDIQDQIAECSHYKNKPVLIKNLQYALKKYSMIQVNSQILKSLK